MEKNVIKKQLPQECARGWAQIFGAGSLFIFVFWNTCFCFRKFVYLFVFWNGLGVFSFVWLCFTQQQHSYNSRRAVVLKMASAKNGIRIIISIQNYIDKKVSISLPWDGTNRETKWNFLLFFHLEGRFWETRWSKRALGILVWILACRYWIKIRPSRSWMRPRAGRPPERDTCAQSMDVHRWETSMGGRRPQVMDIVSLRCIVQNDQKK